MFHALRLIEKTGYTAYLSIFLYYDGKLPRMLTSKISGKMIDQKPIRFFMNKKRLMEEL